MGALIFVPVSNSILTTNIIAQTICNGHDLNPVGFLLLSDFLSNITEVQCPRLLSGVNPIPAQPLGLVTLEIECSVSTGNFPDNQGFRKANLFFFVMVIRTFWCSLCSLYKAVSTCAHSKTCNSTWKCHFIANYQYYRNIVRGNMKRFSLIVCNLRHVLKYKNVVSKTMRYILSIYFLFMGHVNNI